MPLQPGMQVTHSPESLKSIPGLVQRGSIGRSRQPSLRGMLATTKTNSKKALNSSNYGMLD
jgi:hypothetical protein